MRITELAHGLDHPEGVCWDPGTGVLRHLDAGYDEAREAASEHGLEAPGQPS